MKPYRYPDGTRVKIITGDLKGSEGVVANYYRQRDVYSLRIRPMECTDRTMIVAPDGYIHWLAEAAEIESMSTRIHLT